MRKLWILVIILIGAIALIEVYSSLEYPAVDYSPIGLPPLQAGAEYRYDFFKDGSRVGSYVFRVEKIGQFNGQRAYFSSSLTSIVYKNNTLDLETIYVFNDMLSPLDYRINATIGSDYQTTVCLFNGSNVDVSMRAMNDSLRRKVELPSNTILIDNNMIGHWDLFFKSFDPIPGKRVSFTMFVPQAIGTVNMEVIVDRDTRTITLNGVNYECRVIRGTEQSIIFYLYKGDLIRFEDQDQNIVIERTL